MTDPIAQGAETAPNAEPTNLENQQTQTSPQAQEPNNGFKSRIDELTAEKYELRRQFDAQQAQLAAQAQLVEKLTERAFAPQAPTAPQYTVPEGMDPAHAQFFMQLQAEQAKNFQAALGTVTKTVHQQQLESRLQALMAQHPPDISSRAAQLVQVWGRDGKTGWEPEDAFKYAVGEQAYANMAKNANSAAIRNFGGFQQPGFAASPPSSAAPVAKSVPADIESWDAQKQAEWWEKHVGDAPL